jgi:lycopene beta-cyclase
MIDTRPIAKPRPGDALLWQSFSGVEIVSMGEHFDPTLVDLMDFSLKSVHPIAFTYMLPLSKNLALIEVTVFGPDPLYPVDLDDCLDQAIRSRLQGHDFSILRREHCILPMGQKHKNLNSDPTYIKAGLTAGGGRASTGFAFQRIQRWADSCAWAISKGQPLVSHRPDPLLLQAMDKLFLQVLTKSPDLAPQLFFSLFSNVPSHRLIRFLKDHGTAVDCLAIIKALPTKPFLQELRKILMTRSH